MPATSDESTERASPFRSNGRSTLANVTLLLDDGSLARIEPGRVFEWEGGRRYEIELTGFPTASEAEDAAYMDAPR